MRCPLHLFMPLREPSTHLKPNEKLYLYLSLLRDNKTERTWTDVGCHNNGPVEWRRLGRPSGSGRWEGSAVCSSSSASSWRKGSVWRQAGGKAAAGWERICPASNLGGLWLLQTWQTADCFPPGRRPRPSASAASTCARVANDFMGL